MKKKKKKTKLKILKFLLGRIPTAKGTIRHKQKKGKGSYRRKIEKSVRSSDYS